MRRHGRRHRRRGLDGQSWAHPRDRRRAGAYDLAAALFPFALLGLWSVVRSVGGRAGRIGGFLAAAAALSVVLGLLVRAIGAPP
jgi:hypothetical protein